MAESHREPSLGGRERPLPSTSLGGHQGEGFSGAQTAREVVMVTWFLFPEGGRSVGLACCAQGVRAGPGHVTEAYLSLG